MVVYYVVGTLVALGACLVLLVLVGKGLPLEHVAMEESFFPTTPERLYALAVQLQDESDVKTRVLVDSPPNRRVTEVIEGPGAAFGGTWTLECEAADQGTRLAITEHGKVYHPIFRVLSKYVFGHHMTLRQFMKSLKKKVEG